MLDISGWKPFRIGSLFTIKKGKRLTKENQTGGRTPYIGAVDSNNGVTNYIGQEPIHEGNTITLSYNGSVGEAFYQEHPFWATDDVNVLYPRFNLTRNIALFICAVLRLEKYRFAYGRKWTVELMKNSIIYLPEKESKPNWQLMEDFISEKYKKIERKSHIRTSSSCVDVTQWKQFKISDLFDCSIARSEDFGNIPKGNTPFIGRTENDNGLQGYVEGNKLNKGQCITIGMVGTMKAYWQELDFAASQNILILRRKGLNKYVALFLTTVLQHTIRNKYSYNRPIQKEKFKHIFLKLPVDSSGNPDWAYMENYIKGVPYSDLI